MDLTGIELWADEFPFLGTIILCAVIGIFAGIFGALTQAAADYFLKRLRERDK